MTEIQLGTWRPRAWPASSTGAGPGQRAWHGRARHDPPKPHSPNLPPVPNPPRAQASLPRSPAHTKGSSAPARASRPLPSRLALGPTSCSRPGAGRCRRRARCLGPRHPEGSGPPRAAPHAHARTHARLLSPLVPALSMYSRLYGHIFLVKLTGLLSGFLSDTRPDYHITPVSYTNILLYIQ